VLVFTQNKPLSVILDYFFGNKEGVALVNAPIILLRSGVFCFGMLLLSLLSTYAYAQPSKLNITHYRLKDGLSHRDVQCIHQDDYGFLWLGTKNGLNRFDGYDFKHFNSENSELGSNEINAILQDNNGMMWLFSTGAFNDKTVEHLYLFNPINSEVQSLKQAFDGHCPFQADAIIDFTQESKDGVLYFLTSTGIYAYDGTFKKHPFSLPQMPGNKNCRFYHAPDGSFLLYAANQVYIFKETLFGPYNIDIFPSEIYHLSQANGYYKALFYNEKQGSGYFSIPLAQPVTTPSRPIVPHFKPFDVSPLWQNIKYAKRQGSADWVVTSGEELWYLPHDDGATAINISSYAPDLNKVTDIFFASERTAWVATQFGFYRINRQQSLFRTILSDRDISKFDFSCRRIAIAEDNQLWLYLENKKEIWKADLATGKAQKLENWPSAYHTIITNGRDKSVLVFHTNQLCRIQQHKKTCIEIQPTIAYPWTLYEDRFGKVWITDLHRNQIIYLSPENRVKALPQWAGAGKRGHIYQILETNSDTAWLASSIGLFAMNIHTGERLAHYHKDGKAKAKLRYDNIFHIHPAADGSLWLGTSYGLVHWSPGQGVLKRITRTHGLPDNTIYAVYEDDNDNFWLPTDHGIAKYNKKSGHIQGYTTKEGLSNNEFNRVAHRIDEAGNFYFGTLHGITAFHPKDLAGDSSAFHIPLQITSLQQFDGKTQQLLDRTAEIRQSKQIKLAPNDHFFKLDFALLAYEDISNLGYAYQLEGIHDEWYFQRENYLRFSRLPYGKHTLKIKGQTQNGQWSEEVLSIDILVQKPFYFQSWFILLAAFILATAMALFLRWRTWKYKQDATQLKQAVRAQTATIRKQADELRQLDKLKSRFFANVSHELRTPLTLMLGPVETLLKQDKDEKERTLLQYIYRNTQQLKKLINEILDLSKLEKHKMEIVEEPVYLYDYIKEQMAQFRSAASSKGINFIFQYQLEKSLVLMLDRHKVEKIIQNYLSNALKFTTSGGRLHFTVKPVVEDSNEAQTYLLIAVGDSGPGIHPSDLPHIFDRFYQSKQSGIFPQGGTGIGLSLCKELAGLLGGKVWAESTPGKGSTFFFQCPATITAANTTFETAEGQKEESLVTIAANATDSATRGAPLAAHESPQKTPILLVEDNSDLQQYLKMLLSDYDVITAGNGKEALEVLGVRSEKLGLRGELVRGEGREVKLIISDLMMPEMDGAALLANLKSDDRFRHLPVIMLTAKVNQDAKLDALRVGVDDYLNKPFHEEELKARIANLLRNYQQRQEFFSALNVEASNAEAQSSNPVREIPNMSQEDMLWLKEVEKVSSEIMPDPSLKLDYVANKLHLSQRQFRRRLKQLTGLTPNQYLQEMRLQTARDYLLAGVYTTVKEAGFAVGFKNTRYFSDLFQRQYGVRPSEIR